VAVDDVDAGAADGTLPPAMDGQEPEVAILENADLAEALAWARKGAKMSRARVEVREIFFRPAPVQD